MLQPGVSYVFTLNAAQVGVTLQGGASTGSIAVVGPPSPGAVTADPNAGDALSTVFNIVTSGWTAPGAGGGGGVGGLRYTLGYVAVGAGGAEAEVVMSSQSAATTVGGLLPANVTADGTVVDARVFAYTEVAGGGGARARIEGAVRVNPVVGRSASEGAAAALEAGLFCPPQDCPNSILIMNQPPAPFQADRT